MLVRTETLLSNSLLGGIQRIKQEPDERQMRSFNDGELVCAEVQFLHQRDSVLIYTHYKTNNSNEILNFAG